MPKVSIDADYCKSCGYCVVQCPKKVLEIGEKVNAKGYRYVEVVNPDACIACKICATICPDAVIEIYK